MKAGHTVWVGALLLSAAYARPAEAPRPPAGTREPAAHSEARSREEQILGRSPTPLERQFLKLAREDLDAAIERIEQIKDLPLKASVTNIVIQVLCVERLDLIGKLLRLRPPPPRDGDLEAGIFYRDRYEIITDYWVPRNLPQLVRIAGELPGEEQTAVIAAIAKRSAQKEDISGLKSLYGMLPATLQPSALESYLRACTSPPSADLLEWLSQFPKLDGAIIEALLRRSYFRGDTDLSRWLVQHTTGEDRMRALRGLGIAIGSHGVEALEREKESLQLPEEDMDWLYAGAVRRVPLTSLEPVLQQTLQSGNRRVRQCGVDATSRLFFANRNTALDFVKHHFGDLQLDGVGHLTSTWFGESPTTIDSEFLPQLEEGPMRDTALATLSRLTFKKDPAMAVHYAESIGDEKCRQRCLQSIKQ